MVFLLQVLNILLGDLNITFQFENVDEILSLVSKFHLEIINLLRSSWIFKLIKDIEEHCVLIRLLHDLCNLVVQIKKQASCWMINNVNERFKTNSSLSNVSVEESNSDDDIGQLTKLSDLLWSGKRDEWSESSSWEH